MRRVRTNDHYHWVLFLGLIVLLFSGVALANGESNNVSDSRQPTVIKCVLKNGLTILVKPSSANQVITVNAFLRMGALYESDDQRGLSALMQRVITKGTKTRQAQEIVFEAESAGSSIRANLIDYGIGQVVLRTTRAGMKTGFDLFLDVLCHPSFPEAEVAKEKQLLIKELLASHDQPFSEVYQNYLALFYEGYSMGMPQEKIAERVKGFARADIERWYRRIYVPNNMVISIAGNVEPDAMIRMIEKAWGRKRQGELPQVASGKPVSRSEVRQVVKQWDTQALFMMLGYPAPALCDPDYPVMEVISYILGGDMGSRLFVELRDKKGLAYNVGTGYGPGNYPANIFTFIATAPTNYQAVKEGVIAEFNRIANEPVGSSELAQAKQAIRGRFMMAHETNANQSGVLGTFELNGLGYQYDEIYPELVSKVTADDILRVAKKYFNHYTMSVVSPVDIKKP
jgi:zinc protease